jgi:hypothetical protein
MQVVSYAGREHTAVFERRYERANGDWEEELAGFGVWVHRGLLMDSDKEWRSDWASLGCASKYQASSDSQSSLSRKTWKSEQVDGSQAANRQHMVGCSRSPCSDQPITQDLREFCRHVGA